MHIRFYQSNDMKTLSPLFVGRDLVVETYEFNTIGTIIKIPLTIPYNYTISEICKNLVGQNAILTFSNGRIFDLHFIIHTDFEEINAGLNFIDIKLVLVFNECIDLSSTSTKCNVGIDEGKGESMTGTTEVVINTEVNEMFEELRRRDAHILTPKVKDIYVSMEKQTIVIKWQTGEQTKVTCQKGDKFDLEKGIAMAITKYVLGNNFYSYNVLDKYIKSAKITNVKSKGKK